MEILGIGPQELIFIVIIALIVLGPKDMQKAGRTIGRWLNKVVKSDGWKAFQQTSRELRNLPNTLMREANMDLTEAEKDIRKSMKMPPFPGMPVGPNSGPTRPPRAENSIQPPPATKTDTPESETTHDDPNLKDDEVSTPNQNA